MMRILVTGAAGFIGFHVTRALLERGDQVAGLDNLNNYYDARLKHDRLAQLAGHPHLDFRQIDLCDRDVLERLWESFHPDRVVHLAAQAGVRYSLDNPRSYGASNLTGFLNILECCRNAGTGHLVFASSSSVYGSNTEMPFSEHQNVDHPLSLYAATKKSNELMAHSYAHLFGLPCTGLRFFTVYGPWGRPDMAMFLFSKAILSGTPIDVFNHGQMRRDFTYIDDIVEGILRTLDHVPLSNADWSSARPDPATSRAPYRIYNIGNGQPVELLQVIELLERELGRPAIKNLLPMQPGDVLATYADVNDLARDVGFRPATPIEDGIRRFADWYRSYYKD